MADDSILLNLATEAGGKEIATVNQGGFQHEKVVAEFLIAGVPQTVDSGNPLPVTDAAAEVSLASIDTKTPSLGQALAAASVPIVLTAAQLTTLTPPAAITGFATETTLDSIKDTDGIKKITDALPAGTNNIGDVDIASIAAGDNNIGNVDIASIAAGDNNIGNVDIVTRPVATPNKTGGGTLVSLQTCASGAVVIGSAVDISGKFEVSGVVHIGRTVTTALTNPAKVRIEVSSAASGNDTWASVAEFLSSTIASTTTATLTTGTIAGATTLPMTATAAILIGDIVYIQEAGLQVNSEFRRVITVNANTSVVVEEGCTYAHTITTSKVWSKADYFPFKILVGSNMRIRAVIDCAYANVAQTIVAEVLYSQLDSIT